MRTRRTLAAIVLFASVLAIPGASQAAPKYRQPVWFTWNKAHLRTVVVPPNHGQIVNGNGVLAGMDARELHPLENSYVRATMASIADWQKAIKKWAPTWFRNRFRNDVYLLGRDDVPPGVIQAADIIVVADMNKAFALGVAVRFGGRCIVDNSRMFITSFTDADMYNINAQEYGHCLGLAHVNEASPPNVNNETIRHDPMNGIYADSPGSAGTHLHCISSLNVKGLEEVFRATMGKGTGDPNGVILRSDYKQTNCKI